MVHDFIRRGIFSNFLRNASSYILGRYIFQIFFGNNLSIYITNIQGSKILFYITGNILYIFHCKTKGGVIFSNFFWEVTLHLQNLREYFLNYLKIKVLLTRECKFFTFSFYNKGDLFFNFFQMNSYFAFCCGKAFFSNFFFLSLYNKRLFLSIKIKIIIINK